MDAIGGNIFEPLNFLALLFALLLFHAGKKKINIGSIDQGIFIIAVSLLMGMILFPLPNSSIEVKGLVIVITFIGPSSIIRNLLVEFRGGLK